METKISFYHREILYFYVASSVKAIVCLARVLGKSGGDSLSITEKRRFFRDPAVEAGMIVPGRFDDIDPVPLTDRASVMRGQLKFGPI